MKYLVLLLSLFCLKAQAAITFIAEASDETNGATSATPAEPTGTAENDLVIVFASIAIQDGTWTDPADFTEIDNNTWGSGSADHTYIGYKVRGATAGSGYAFSYSGTADRIRATAITLRGIDTSTPIDVTYSTVSHYNENVNDGGLIAPSAATTVTDGAWMVVAQFIGADGAFTQGVPSGYTARADYQVVDEVHQIATLEVATAGTSTPGAWTHTGVGAAADSANYTVVIRPAAAASNDDAAMRRRIGD